MKVLYKTLLLVVLNFLGSPVYAALTIDITSGVDDPIVISNVPFAWQASSAQNQDIAAIIDADLERSGYFNPVARSQMQERPQQRSQIDFANWRKLASEYLVIGRIKNAAGDLSVEYELFNVITQERVLTGTLQGSNTQLRAIAHRISDLIFKKITGLDGFFSGSILYVSSQRVARGRFNYQLIKADVDAEKPQIILESSEPIMSPSWAPDKKRIAYVSFEKGRAEIYIQSVATGQRTRVAAYSGINGAPSWSPDGSRLAFTLSKDGNPEIYVLNLSGGQLQRITNNTYAIDTEPSWFPDGQSLVFTSDRGGQAQLYKVNIYNRQVSRITFNGNYNARGQVFPDGRYIAMVHREEGAYRIAVQNLQTGQFQVVSKTSEDESPSVAANSNMLMYATKRGGRSALAVVSIDGRTRYYIPSASGSVRDPSWSK